MSENFLKRTDPSYRSYRKKKKEIKKQARKEQKRKNYSVSYFPLQTNWKKCMSITRSGRGIYAMAAPVKEIG